jgi:hypothetical protein
MVRLKGWRHIAIGQESDRKRFIFVIERRMIDPGLHWSRDAQRSI